MGTCAKVVFSVAVVLGLAMIVTGVVIFFLVLPVTFKEKIGEGLLILNGTDMAKRFEKSPVPYYASFYVFSVTNVDEVINGSARPVLEEKGPYVFRQEKQKTLSNWDHKLGTVFYKERTYYYFEPEMTNGSLDDEVNHVNIFSIGLVTEERSKKLFESIQIDYTDFVTNVTGPLIDTNTVGDLLFQGYDVKKFIPTYLNDGQMFLICFLLGDCKFGVYKQKNGTISKEFEISSGEQSLKNYGEVITYDGKRSLNYWHGPSCNALNGTDGAMFPPPVDSGKGYYVFSPELCRSLLFAYDREFVIQDIDTLRYVVPPEVFSDPNEYPDNMCFCQRPQLTTPCPIKAGVISVSSCQEGNPVAMSAAHFYLGSQEYVDAFPGLNPVKEKHETVLYIEPMTGTTLSAAKRIQVNVVIKPNPRIPFLNSIQNLTFFPLMWVEERASMDEDSAREFREKVINPYKTAKWSVVAVIAIGCVILLMTSVVSFLKACR